MPEEQQNKKPDRRRSVKLKFMGVEAEIRGYDIVIVLILLAVCFIVLEGYHHVQATEKQHVQIHETVNEMVYVLTLDDEERKKLNLSMPDSLKNKRRRFTPNE